MKYIAHVVQNGEGCDYTIGCGLDVVELTASDLEGAKQELKEVIKERFFDDTALESAVIYEVSNAHDVDLDVIYNSMDDDVQSEKSERQRLSDFEEYQRLKKKFDKE